MTDAPKFDKWRSFIGPLCAVFALLALIVCGALYYSNLRRAKPISYASAILTVRDYRPIRSTKITLDAASANRLATFFPQFGTGKDSGIAGTWMPTVEVDFTAADGTVTHVASNFDVWSEGRGDWPSQPGLEAFVSSIRREAERGSQKDSSTP